MKDLILLIFCLISTQVLLTQPVINNNYNLEIGDTYRNDLYDEVADIDPGPAGPNQVWDFGIISGGLFTQGTNNICVVPSTTPFADSLMVSYADVCIVDSDNPDQGIFQYINVDNNFMEMVAIGFLGAGNNSFNHYEDFHRIIEYPLAYGGSFDDTFDFYTYMIDLGFYFMRDSAFMAVEADAWGSITTPARTFLNTLRVKRVMTDYLWICYQPGGDWNYNGSFTTTEYLWYAPGIKMPVMNITQMSGSSNYSVVYLAEYDFQTGISEIRDYQLEIFPNPANNWINIKSDRFINQLSVSSIDGVDIFKSRILKTCEKVIDLSNFPKGFYILGIELEGGKMVNKTIIKQ